MSDFPYPLRFHLPVITTLSREFGVASTWTWPTASGNVSGQPASAAWPGANTAFYASFNMWAPYLVKTLVWWNGATATGNVDCGIFAPDGTLLASAGSTAQSGTSAPQKTALGTPLLLESGSYYLGLVASSASSTFIFTKLGTGGTPPGWGTALMRAAGGRQMASAGPPLTNATFASLSTFGAAAGAPVFGISSRVSTLV